MQIGTHISDDDACETSFGESSSVTDSIPFLGSKQLRLSSCMVILLANEHPKWRGCYGLPRPVIEGRVVLSASKAQWQTGSNTVQDSRDGGGLIGRNSIRNIQHVETRHEFPLHELSSVFCFACCLRPKLADVIVYWSALLQFELWNIVCTSSHAIYCQFLSCDGVIVMH